jgi:excisionase family DNA binding protein
MGEAVVPAAVPKVLLTVEEAAEVMSLGRTFVYRLVMRQEIRSVKLGRVRRIPYAALQEFVERHAS